MEPFTEEELNVLTERERTVITHRFALEGGEPKTLKATGQILGLSSERTRQIQINGLSKLRRLITRRDEIVPSIQLSKFDDKANAVFDPEWYAIPTMTKNALEGYGITSFEQLSRITDRKMLSIRHVGKKGWNYIVPIMVRRGLWKETIRPSLYRSYVPVTMYIPVAQ